MQRAIAAYETPVLRQKGAVVTDFGPETQALAQDLLDSLAATDNGIGLAAQQIGVARRMCAVDVRGIDPEFRYTLDGRAPPLDLIMPLVLVNPKVVRHLGRESGREEGCLSFPGLNGVVRRKEHVVVEFQDLQGGRHTLECDGMFGRCVQHEMDHLEGVLFIDRMDKASLRAIEEEVRELRQRTRTAAAG